MHLSQVPQLIPELRSRAEYPQPHILVGITHSQTCLNLVGRLRSLREAGFRVTLVASPGKLLEQMAESEGVESVPISIQREIAPLSDIVSLVHLWSLLRRLHPDITEFSTPKAGLLGTVAARLAGVHTRVYMLRGLKLETCTGWKRPLLLISEKVAAACSQVVLCNSASLRKKALDLGLASGTKLQMLGDGSSNGVDAVRFSPGPSTVRQQLGLPQNARVVGFVGRLTRDKGLPELMEAFDAILAAEPETWLLLVGWFDASEDALGREVRARILTHPRVLMTGFVADTAPYFRAMDLLVLPTWREGFPNVVLEAEATGIPVVTTVCTGSCDAVLPEVTGLLIPAGYPEAISETVLKLLRDRRRCRRMGKAGRAWVLEHFAHRRVLDLTTAFYKSLLAQANKQGVQPAVNLGNWLRAGGDGWR